MWAEGEEESSILAESVIGHGPSVKGRQRINSPSPHPMAPPAKLYNHSSPCSPVGGIVSGCSLELLAGEPIAKVINDVPEIVGVDCECFYWFDTCKCRRGGWKPLNERPAKTP